MFFSHVGLIFSLFFFALELDADDIQINAEFENPTVYVGETAILNLVVSNAEGKIEIPSQQFSQFEVSQGGTQTFHTTNIINGHMVRRVSQSIALNLTTNQAGRFDWPTVQVRVGGKIYQSNSVALMVRNIEKQNNVLLLLETDQDEVFLQQKIQIKLSVLLKTFPPPHDNVEPIILGREPHLTIPWLEEKEGFSSLVNISDELSKILTEEGGFQINSYSRRTGIFARNKSALFNLPQSFKEINGQQYLAYTLEQDWLPTKVGSHHFAPITFKGTFPIEIASNRGNLSIKKKKEIRALSNALKITVRDVPLINRPASYTGAIGKFAVQASVDRQNILVGEPLLMTFSVTGNGLLDPVAMPDLNSLPGFSKNFRIYMDNPDGEIRGNKKIFQATLRPLNDQITEIPPIPFTYFDTSKKSFTEIESVAIPLTVSATGEVDATDVATPFSEIFPSEEVQIAEKGLVEAMTASEILALNPSSNLPTTTFMKILNGLLALALIGLKLYQKVIQPNRGNSVHRLAKTACARARKNIEDLGSLETPEQIEKLGIILLTCLAEKFLKQAAGYTRDDALRDLKESQASEALQNSLLEIIDLTNEIRFGGTSHLASQNIKSDALQLLKELEALS